MSTARPCSRPAATRKFSQRCRAFHRIHRNSPEWRRNGRIAWRQRGFASGSVLLALVPGLGPVTAVGLLGASILRAAGATLGLTAGNKWRRAMSDVSPKTKSSSTKTPCGKAVLVIALTDDSRSTAEIREILSRNRAESIDAAPANNVDRTTSAEESRLPNPHKFSADEQFFRLGFEAAMHARTRCMEFDQISGEMNAALDDVKAHTPAPMWKSLFWLGYQRGREHLPAALRRNRTIG